MEKHRHATTGPGDRLAAIPPGAWQGTRYHGSMSSAPQTSPEQPSFQFAQTATTIAREAGALLREYYERGVATEYKGDVDLVTEADRASEALIKSRLAAAFPEHGIYGEEGTRDRLSTPSSAGTSTRSTAPPTSRTASRSSASCSACEHRAPGLAADEDGEMVAGVIYDPLRDEMFVGRARQRRLR